MVVYVEWVIFDNFCLDCLLACLTLRVTKERLRVLPVILSAILGSGFALLSPLITRFSFLFKIGVLFLCSAVFYAKRSFRGYLVNTLFYAVLSFFLGGILTFLLGGRYERGFIGVGAGGVVGVLSLSCLFLLYAVRQIGGLLREKRRENTCVEAELVNCENHVRIKALFDTGNLLTDPTGRGIVVTDEKRIGSLGELVDCGEMRVRTATGSKILKLVKIPEIKIYSEKGENILFNVTAALSELPEEYGLILPCE